MKITSLDQNRQFQRLYRKGRSIVTPTMVVYALPNRQKACRLGITAGKKVGGAVMRNRAKRRIRELFRLEQPYLKGYDFCIVARTFTVEAPYHKLVRDFRRAMDTLEARIDETALD
ncbi:MAG: ribonuclease P protein component [Clostridia bacterium]|nr:ribonuclease P protein component [Clostridia bacterium]